MDPARICVYAGSSPGADPAYAAAARELGAAIARRGLGLVYGGGSVGLMGEVADAVLDGGGEVIGVLPAALDRREIGHRGLTELRVVATMHERKALMAELAGAFAVLPGGLGTLEELAETATWTQLRFHDKPIGVLDVRGYWDDLARLLDHMVRERFLRAESRGLVLSDRTAAGLLDRLAAWRPRTVEKWMDAGASREVFAVPPRGPLLGVSAVVVRDGRVLLGRRRGAHGAGTWSFPGGKPEPGEAATDAVARELAEETGLRARSVTPIAWTDDVMTADGLHYVTLHHRVEVEPGDEPRRREPDKVDGWSWADWAAPPQPLFQPVEGLRELGWRP